MKYMILTYASQREYDGMAGKPGAPAWTPEEFGGMVEFMTKFNRELEESGELVATYGLEAPVLSRRISGTDEIVVTDGPYAETEEVLAGFWIVECESFDRATEIGAKLAKCPAPAALASTTFADIRPIGESAPDGPEA